MLALFSGQCLALQKNVVLEFTFRTIYAMHRKQKGYLLVRARAIKWRNGAPEGFKIEKTEWIVEAGKEVSYPLLVYKLDVIKLCLNLYALAG